MRPQLLVPSAALSAALLAAPGCDERAPAPEPSAAGEVVDLAPVAPGETPVQAILPGKLAQRMSERYREKYARATPAGDDWDTEQLSSEAQNALKRMLAGALFGAGTEPLQASALAPGLECDDLWPDELELIHEESGLTIRAGHAAGAAFQGQAGFERALSELARPFAGAEGHRLTLKTTRVSVRADPELGRVLETEVHPRVFARLRSGSVQVDATWQCSWTVEPRLRLARVRLEHFTEARLGSGRWFTDVTAAALGSNPSFELQLGRGLDYWAGALDRLLGASTIGHQGLALGDANGDGLDDLYLCQPGGLPNLLFVRRPDGTAEDVSREAGVDWLDPSRSALFVDLDGDGDQDLVVEADPVLILMENDGAGHFVERATAAAPSTTSLSAADYDLDGDVDLYACGYMLPDAHERVPIPYHDANNGRPNTFLRNDIQGPGAGDWVFTDVTREVGLDRNNRRYSFAAAWEDYDDDGDPDVYVANDFGRNNLYRNDGGTFVDVAAEAGVEDMAAGMGVAWSDLDGDGRMDLYVANMFSSAGGRITYQRRFQEGVTEGVRRSYQRHARGNTLFQNLGAGRFADVTEEAGVGMGRWAWGAIAVDLQNDGRPDLVVPNGFVTGESTDDL